MDSYSYRRLRGIDDALRPGERLVQIRVPNAQQAYQGNRPLLPSEVTYYLAERAVPFHSRIRTR